MRQDIEFKTEDGVTLRGWYYLPNGKKGKVPTIVMARGFSAVKANLDRFAEAYLAAGLGAIVFDNRNFGASDGEPRQEIDHGDIMTAGGFMAWVDVGLFLVERILGGAVRAETGRFAGQAHHFHGLAPEQAHGDAAVLKAQEWVHVRDGRDVSLASMASAAGLERRTFLRRFASATGMTPIEYCRAVRIARARELLMSGNTPQKAIAQSLGYKDVASFARVFRKIVGLPPGEFRERFRYRASLPNEITPANSATFQSRILEAS